MLVAPQNFRRYKSIRPLLIWRPIQQLSKEVLSDARRLLEKHGEDVICNHY
jgi:hypothetical protein